MILKYDLSLLSLMQGDKPDTPLVPDNPGDYFPHSKGGSKRGFFNDTLYPSKLEGFLTA